MTAAHAIALAARQPPEGAAIIVAMATFVDAAAAILSSDGKLSGPVLVHYRRTKAFRRAYPSKKPTAPQQRAINAFRYVDLRWQLLPRWQRALWNHRGVSRRVFGYNLYQRVNIPRRLEGLTLLQEPPIILPPPRG